MVIPSAPDAADFTSVGLSYSSTCGEEAAAGEFPLLVVYDQKATAHGTVSCRARPCPFAMRTVGGSSCGTRERKNPHPWGVVAVRSLFWADGANETLDERGRAASVSLIKT